jgi:uncharacterized protein (TIGR03435 family)
MARLFLLLAMFLAVPRFAAAQLLREGKETDRFEVASVKPGPQRPVLQSFPRLQPAGLEVNGASLKDLIVWAYPAVGGQVDMEGAPEWARSERFDLLAKTSGARPTAAMLRALLADRFKLRVRLEPREGNVFDLTMARNDGRPGSGLTESKCKADDSAPEAERCKPIRIACCPGLIGEGVTMAELAGTLTYLPILGAPVLDHTGLTGRYNFDLQYASEGLPNAAQRPDVSTALRDQLGIRLSRTKGTITFVVVEHADKLERN